MVLQGCRVCSVTGHACASSMAYLVPTQRLPPLPGAQTWFNSTEQSGTDTSSFQILRLS